MATPIAALALVAILLGAAPGFAEGIAVEGAGVALAYPGAPTAAAYMTLRNDGGAPDRLLGASSPDAAHVVLHTQTATDGVARMRPAEDGFALPTDGVVTFAPGAAHIMLMGFAAPLADGDRLSLTLVFEGAGEVTLDVPVAIAGGMADHSDHGG